MTDAGTTDRFLLSPRDRFFCVGAGIVVLALAIYYGLAWSPTQYVVAPSCSGAPTGCRVEVTRTPDAALLLGLLVVSGVALLMAVTGRMWTFSVGNAQAAPAGTEVKAAATNQAEVDKETKAKSVGGRKIEVEAGATQRLTSDQSTELYRTLPPDIAAAADLKWREWYRDSLLSQNLQQIRRAEGKGNKAYYLQSIAPDDSLTWLRVSKGGPGTSSRTKTRRATDDETPVIISPE